MRISDWSSDVCSSDLFRVRLTHSLEVAQIGRTTARTLGLNEDLTEALCLAHDIGHPHFGHAGEDAQEAAHDAHGGFDHNAHTQLGSASGRERVCQYVSISVVAVSLKNKKHKYKS